MKSKASDKSQDQQHRLFTRRDLISSAATLMATSPFILWCERARSMTPFAFWKKRASPASGVTYGSSTYPTNTGSDPYWDYVVLCMNMDLPHPSTGFTTVFADESSVGKTPTINGSPYIDTTAGSSPYTGRNGSLKLNGSTDYIAWPSSSDFAFGSSDFTIEIRFKTSASGVEQNLVNNWDYSNSKRSWSLHISVANKLRLQISTDSTSVAATLESGSAVNDGIWHHAVAVRNGNNYYLYLDGVLQNWTSIAGALYAANYCEVGRYANTTSGTIGYFNGAIADLRIYNGVAKYTANFTPRTTPIGLGTANDKYWGYCVLACPFEHSLKDMSGKRPATIGGNATLNSTTRKTGSASSAFDGSGDYIAFNDSVDLSFRAGDFTIEAWVYASSWTNAHSNDHFGIAAKHNGTTSQWVFKVAKDGSNNPKLSFYNNGTLQQGSTTLAPQTWYHVAVVRQGTTGLLFINGAQDSSFTFSADFNDTTQLYIGAQPNDTTACWNGYIDSLRITKGYARYTANFTPPTASFPVGRNETVDPFWTNTVLAMHMDDFTDTTGRHAITNTGSVTNNTTTYKYGTGSTYFSGSNYLTTPDSSDFDFRNDFTIEGWIYLPATLTSYKTLVAKGYGTGSNDSIQVGIDNSCRLYFNANGSIVATGSIAVPATAWTHFAAVRNGSNWLIFQNGIQVASGSASVTININTHALGICTNTAAISGTYMPNIYLDDLRITKGVARYTQNFTPPTRAFATTPVSTYTDFDPLFSSNVLLMPMDNFTDVIGHTVSNAGGGVTTSSSTYKFGTGSSYMNASNQYFYLDQNTDYDFGSAAFTIEMWINGTTWGSNVTLAAKSNYNASTYSFQLGITSAGKLYLNASSNGTSWNLVNASAGATTISLNTWHHVAATRNGNNIYLFVDGALDATISVGSSALATISGNVDIGSMRGVDQFKGYIDDVRITKGVARYTASFAPPSRALPTSAGIVTSGLVALLDAGDAASYDGSSQTWKNISTTFIATLNPSDKYSTVTLSNSNRTATTTSGGVFSVRGNLPISGKIYWEVYQESGTSNNNACGVALSSANLASYAGADANSWGLMSHSGILWNGSALGTYSSTTDGDVVQFAIDSATGYLWIGKNGTWFNSGNPSAGSGSLATVSGTVYPIVTVSNNSKQTIRFNPSEWSYSAPSGFGTLSPASYDVYRGSGSGSDGADPTFAGISGGRSANDYFSFDGGDYFTLAGANTDFLNSLHGTASEFTLAFVGKFMTHGFRLAYTYSNSNQHGIMLRLNTDGILTLYSAGGGTETLVFNSTSGLVGTGYSFIAVSFKRSVSALAYCNGASENVSSTMTATSSSSATYPLVLALNCPAGNILHSVMLYNRALSKAELDQNFNCLRSRFGI